MRTQEGHSTNKVPSLEVMLRDDNAYPREPFVSSPFRITDAHVSSPHHKYTFTACKIKLAIVHILLIYKAGQTADVKEADLTRF